MIFGIGAVCLTAALLAFQCERAAEKVSASTLPIVPIDAIRNPERGFHLEANYDVRTLVNPFSDLTYSGDWFSDLNERYNSQHDELSALQLYLYLTEYVGRPIPDDAFDTMQMLFDDAKAAGYKFVLRFAYDTTYGETDASFDDVFRHLDQLEPFIRKNIGLIDIWQIGFIGAWGEGHNSPMTADYEGRTEMARRILDIFEDRQTTIRYPDQKNRLRNTEAYKRRMGFNNDYFTASEHPRAPENDYVFGTPVYKQVKAEAPYVKVIGEIPYAEETEWGLHEIISVPNTLKILRDHHYSLFDITQNNALNIAYWKTYPVFPAMLSDLGVLFDERYFVDGGEPCSRSAYQFIRDHLGYRLYLDTAATKISVAGHRLTYQIGLRNVGFSTIHNPRDVYLALIDENEGTVMQTVKLAVDPSTWQPYRPGTEDYTPLLHTVEGSMPISVDGPFKVGLWLPDPTEQLRLDSRYAIAFANESLAVWEDAAGQYRVNIVAEFGKQ